MEDYQSAFLQRHKDTEILCSSNRKVAAMHFGGVTIECLLKSMILASLPKSAKREWKTDSNNHGHTITNPGHSFQDALKRHHKLYDRVQKIPQVMKWLVTVENPKNQHFIDMRYDGSEPNDEDYKQWLSAYKSLIGWLQKQATQL
ncbi:hypothetical protein [Planktothrix agardhii]|jgi:hypothetical protein|uniref:hypothetical protein n=1 Tax=Planktothrix agardhii TaxID=1160 RepID=UPI0005A81798|nr:hypothetical protein [Planktothrix agardhii]BBD55514.1 hypothetical protein NIES204_28230 [Planktothrix agardhii NIES-204]MCB8777207.1 hypothetical protein [Planktothrix agardhii 1031]MCF3599288.1 hypothetical protein [Planktothrix agardhii 1032]MCP9294506.1 hypothetical protein [Planktothrix agardhii LY1]MEA5562085.1 hypothetical protein [Planktothrix agardhii UHCC 0887]